MEDFLLKTEQLIEERLLPIHRDDIGGRSESILAMICRHLCISPHAKRARPLLCLYYHWMFSEEILSTFVQIGVAAEFIHAASLLHDDIIDDADKRRGKLSANRRFGNAKAVLAGDFLLTEAFDLLRPFDRALSDRAIFVVREMTRSAILEFDARGNIDVSIDEAKAIYKGKTGVLFSWCGFAASHCAGAESAAMRLWDVGERIGLIFQLADDLKDFDGDKNLKDACRDLCNQEASVPIILAIGQNPAIKERFKKAFSGDVDEGVVQELRDLVKNSGAVDATRVLIEEELSHVRTALAAFDGTRGKMELDHFIDELASVEI